MANTAGALVQTRFGSLAGEAAKQEGKLAAKQIDVGVTAREADRKEQLARAMATTIAQSGAKGVSAFEGSPVSVISEGLRLEGQASERDKFTSDLQKLTAKARGRVAKQSIRAQSSANLFSALPKDVGSLASLLGGVGG